MRVVRHRGKWAARFEDGRRYSTGLPATAEHREAAERKARQIEAETRTPLETVADIWAAYMLDHGDKCIASDRLEFAWKALKPHFAHLTPDLITRDICREYIANRRTKRGEPAKPATTRRELVALNAALRWHNKATPAVLELPRAPVRRDRYLTRHEYERLLTAATTDHIRLFIRLALVTGARTKAVLRLPWLSVRFDKRRIWLGHVEGGKGRATVPMTDATMSWLQEAHQRKTCDWVIEWNGGPVQSIKKSFARTADRAGLDDVSPHVLRHTAAVWMAEDGRGMAEIAQYLGHTDSRITERVYARFSPDYLRKAAASLDV